MPSEDFNLSDVPQKTLGEWQQIAISHFNTLSSSKKDKKLPLFSLEHSFTPFQLERIFRLLLKDYGRTGINRSYWLLWVIYSTEIGYAYTGEEYWQSFEEKILSWDLQHREDIRWAFKEFQKKFFGMKPTGSWANHFTIISLPITHAILPKDLQSHFANLLFFCRYKLRSVSLNNPETIGKLLSANSYMINSSRFQNFLQQEELVGRIALSLLDESITAPMFELLHPSTLKRIVSDLEQKRNAKEWVQETRREIKPRILGTASTFYSKQSYTETKDPQSKRILRLKPKLKLFQLEKNKWTVIIEIPQILDSLDDPSLVTLIKQTRIQISGVKGSWIPAESLLHNSLKRRLDKWPETESLLKFEQQNSALQSLFDQSFKLTEEPWLFIVGTDGIATEIEGKFLRPGKRYILLYKNAILVPEELKQDVTIECEAVIAKELILSTSISEQEEITYKQWGFEVFKTLTIWPAGLSARNWDGEGTSEWLTTESPCFGISHDYELDELTIRISSESLTLNAKKPGEVTFIALNPLSPGQHVLSIKPKSRHLSANEGLLLLDVREPVIWTPGAALHNGLTAFLDPNDDSFDSFFRGKTELMIYAPQNRYISIQIELFLDNHILDIYISEPISLPFTSEKLKTIRSQIGSMESFGAVQKAKLTVFCEGIGQREFMLSRNVKSFRWIYQVLNNAPYIRLIDETDSQEEAELVFYDLLHPDQRFDLSNRNFLQKAEIEKANGLFWAKKLDYEHGIIISDIQTPKKDFGFLSISPTLKTNIPINFLQHLRLIQAWYNAQCVTFLAQIHLEKIMEVLAVRLYGQLCGSAWAQEEFDFIANPDFGLGFEALSQKVKNRSIANVVRHRLKSKSIDELNFAQELNWFVGAVERCDLSDNSSLVISTVMFAANPLNFISRPEPELNSLIDKISNNPDLLRASRLLILGISKILEPHKNFALLFPGGIK